MFCWLQERNDPSCTPDDEETYDMYEIELMEETFFNRGGFPQ